MSDSKSRAQIHEDSKENSKFSHDETKHPAPYEEGQKKSHDLNDSSLSSLLNAFVRALKT